MPKNCPGCPTCTAGDRRSDNIDRVRAANVILICENCGTPSETVVGRVIGSNFRFVCCKAKEKKR